MPCREILFYRFTLFAKLNLVSSVLCQILFGFGVTYYVFTVS